MPLRTNRTRAVRKRSAPADFDDHDEGRNYHPRIANHGDRHGNHDPGPSQVPAAPGEPVQLTAFGEPAFIRFNHVDKAPTTQHAIPDQPVPERGFMNSFLGRMMSSVFSAFADAGRNLVAHFFQNDPSHNVVERRHFNARDGSWSNKRAKIRYIREHANDPLPMATTRGPNPRWCDDENEIEAINLIGHKYLTQFQTLSAALHQYAWTDIELRDAAGEVEIIEQIKWAETGLFNSSDEIGPAFDANNPRDPQDPRRCHYTKLIQALSFVSSFLQLLYNFDNIRASRRKHGWQLHHDYFHMPLKDQKESFVKFGTVTKQLLSNEYFLALVTYLNRILPIEPEAQLTRDTVKRILLDIHAIENNLTPPSYVKGDVTNIYEIEVKLRFPPPKWMDLPVMSGNPLASQYLPGKFPESPQHSRLDYDFYGQAKHVPHAAVRGIPPPLPAPEELPNEDDVSSDEEPPSPNRSTRSRRSGSGSLDTPSRDKKPKMRRDECWKVINARVRKTQLQRRCKNCKNMPYRCWRTNCKGDYHEPPPGYYQPASPFFQPQIYDEPETTYQPQTFHQPEPQSPHHSPHHRFAPRPPGIIKRSHRHDPYEVAEHIDWQQTKSVTFASSTDNSSDLRRSTLNLPPQSLDQSLSNHFNEPADAWTTHLQSYASKESIIREQQEALAKLEAIKARELEAKLARTGGLRAPNLKLVEHLSEDVEHHIRATLHAASTKDLAKTGEGVDLRRSDFAKVVPETEWLNDEIVNGTLNWLDKAVNSAAGIKNVRTQTRKCAVFNSFFFKMLRDQGAKKGVRPLGRMGIKKENFFDVETLLLPICENSHWTLLVVRPQKKTVSHMDSLNFKGNSTFTNLALEWLKEFLGDMFVPEDWKTVRHDAPRQVNGWDCGVHIISNAMCLALGLNPIDSYLPSDMPLQRLRVAGMLLNGGFHGEYSLQAL